MEVEQNSLSLPDKLNFPVVEAICKWYPDELKQILQSHKSNIYYDFKICVITLLSEFPKLSDKLFNTPRQLLEDLSKAVIDAQHIIKQKIENEGTQGAFSRYLVKELISVVFENVPVRPPILKNSISDLDVNDLDKFIMVGATVIRVGNRKALEEMKIYECTACKFRYQLPADVTNMNRIQPPPKCTNLVTKLNKPNPMWNMFNKMKKKMSGGAGGNEVQQPVRKTKEQPCGNTKLEPIAEQQYWVDYQEIKIQESFRTFRPGNIPKTMWVILKGNQVDKCRPGDDIMVSGVLIRRWKKVIPNMRPDVIWSIEANNLYVMNKESEKIANTFLGQSMADPSMFTVEEQIELFWMDYSQTRELQIEARNKLIKSICPQIYQRYELKLALLLSLIGGVPTTKDGTKIRGMCHILMVGEPGTGKSHMLRYASNLSSRAVMANGIGSTSAGLTISCIKENGEFMFEAGALVLADMGICCIDEFNLLHKGDLVSIHEAMEQQTISVSKAGMTSTAYTRATIIAACNPVMPGQKYNHEHDLCVNTGLQSPLLSRFDLIFVMMDQADPERDNETCDFILNKFIKKKGATNEVKDENHEWDIDKMREYIKYVKEKFEPIMSQEAMEIVQAYYVYCRTREISGRSTLRLLESLIRLCQAHARLMFKDIVELFDAISIIILMESAFYTGLIDVENFQDLVIITDINAYEEVEQLIIQKLKTLPNQVSQKGSQRGTSF